VFKALHVPSLTLVAEKVVSVADERNRQQLMQELKTLSIILVGSDPVREDDSTSLRFATTRSACVVGILDAFPNVDDDSVSVCLEYMDGGSLQDIVQSGGCQNEVVLAGIAHQVLLVRATVCLGTWLTRVAC
jgi:serine/threonine protein kinase